MHCVPLWSSSVQKLPELLLLLVRPIAPISLGGMPPTAFAFWAVPAFWAFAAFATERLGAALLISFLAMLRVCFFSFLLSTLTVATVATALPATANTKAMIATTMAGEGALRLTLPIWISSDSLALARFGTILCRRFDGVNPTQCIHAKRYCFSSKAIPSPPVLALLRRPARQRCADRQLP